MSKVPDRIGSVEFKAILPPYLEDELITLINSWFPDQYYTLEVGMTKTTIILAADNDWVYKIPHNGIYVPICKEFDGIPQHMYFSYLKDNSLKQEFSFYLGIPEKLKPFFLKVFPYMHEDTLEIYRQERVEVLPENIPEMPLPSILTSKIKFHIPSFWVNRAIQKTDLDTVIELVDYLNENEDISQDLNPNNLGINKYGFPVILDYSGLYSIVED